MKVTHLPYMGEKRSVVMEEQNAEILFDPHSALGLIIDETTMSEGADPLEILEAFEEWLMKEHGMTMIQAAAAAVRAKV